LLARRTKGRNLYTATIGDGQQRVVCVKAWFDTDEDDAANTGNTGES
jgi:hypothetical protein